MLKIEHLTKVYDNGTVALKDVSFEVPDGEFLAVIGLSGSGKSPLLRCINRLIEPTEGRILWNGVDIASLSQEELRPVRRRIGMVFQKPNPFPKSIYDNVAWGAKINGYKGNMDDLVEESLHGAALWDEVKDKLQESGNSLSGGQQQRLCKIGRAHV